MSYKPLIGDGTAGESEPACQLRVEKPALKILLYTDNPTGIQDGEAMFDLGVMLKHLRAHAPAFATVDTEWVSRYSEKTGDADKKLDGLLTQSTVPYDEVWFFGLHQENVPKYSSGVGGGGPESELEKKEIDALRNWMQGGVEKGMRGGGVLMTGDHNHPRPEDALPGNQSPPCPDSSTCEEFFGLGRALGRCVPRAGRLRKWEGQPTNRKEDSVNTQVPNLGADIESSLLQLDSAAQQLLLETFDETGKPTQGGLPHPLFFYKSGSRILFFPDHAHEGVISLPDKSEFANLDEWPKCKDIQPRPQVVAHGIDSRNCKVHALVAAYDGDLAGVGRIVADSTWHHYVNVNLTSFPHPSASGSPGDQIGQFYGNLAIWLAPREQRYQMACAMFWWLANHPLMVEEIGGHVLNIGSTAYFILSKISSPCEIHELLQAAVPAAYSEQFESFYFPEAVLALSQFPSKSLILGCVLDGYHKEMIRFKNSDGTGKRVGIDEVIAAGFKRAFKEHAAAIGEIQSKAEKLATL
ncbi:MAG TPA: hypothetical protein VEQ40_09355 [Pyrinomonadaceae bacterium]|nr:hypothetical protein [Pyrinomonadaceae bacterium]